MKFNVFTLLCCIQLICFSTSSAQCPIPNKDFTGYWIAATLINFGDIFDPEDWASTAVTGQNALNYGYSGLYPAHGAVSISDAVEFDLSGAPTETGIRTLAPIVCSDFPTHITGRFKHTGIESDTLYFSLFYTALDVISGDTIREINKALLVCNTQINSTFQSFDIPIALPHLNIYSQIDTIEIAYKSRSFNPGIFYLDAVDFGYASSTHNSPEAYRNLKIFPSITAQNARIELPAVNMQINVVNAIGTSLLSMQSAGAKSIDLDLGGLASGLYYVIGKPENGSEVYVGKVMKL